MRIPMLSTSRLFLAVLLGGMAMCSAIAQAPEKKVELDSDHDGMSDALEQALLVQFEPRFMVGRHDCAGLPARFAPNIETPTVEAEDGTVYGQVFPAKPSGDGRPMAEIHFYHLWGRDCGPHGHHLDTEHVAVLVMASDSHLDLAQWKAVYWYAAAHENTVCDVSQITRASTLGAEESGARVWISPGKHASHLNEKLCHAGCNVDKCADVGGASPGKDYQSRRARPAYEWLRFYRIERMAASREDERHEFSAGGDRPVKSNAG